MKLRTLIVALATAVFVGGAGSAFADGGLLNLSSAVPSGSWSGSLPLLGGSSDSETISLDGTGTLSVSIDWPLATNNLDLTVTKGGATVAKSAHLTGTEESVSIGNASGTYVAKVTAKLVSTASYTGHAAVAIAQSVASSGGGGSGHGSGGSGGTGGTGGSTGGSSGGSAGGHGGSARGTAPPTFAGPMTGLNGFSGFAWANGFYTGPVFPSNFGQPGTQRSVTLQPVYASNAHNGTSERTSALGTDPRIWTWVAVVALLGVVIFALSAYAVLEADVEPGDRAHRGAPTLAERIAVIPAYSLGGLLLRAVAAVARVGRRTVPNAG
jgi:hypothetical protein